MENDIEKQGGLSANHLRELESVISQILTNQEIIINQQKELLDSKKMDRIWGIIKAVLIWIVLPMILMAYMPQLIEKMTGQINGVMQKQIQNVTQGSGSLDVEKATELINLINQ